MNGDDFPNPNHDSSEGEQWGRYNLPRLIHFVKNNYMFLMIFDDFCRDPLNIPKRLEALAVGWLLVSFQDVAAALNVKCFSPMWETKW